MGVGWGTAGEGWDGSAAAGGRNFAVFREEAMDFHSKKFKWRLQIAKILRLKDRGG